MVTPGNSVTSECLHREEAEVAPMAKVRRSRSAFVPFSPHLARALVRAQAEKCGMPQATLGGPLDEPYLRHEFRPHPLHLPHLARRHAAAPAGRLRLRQIDEGAVIAMMRLQHLEDLTAQVRNEAGPHLASEPLSGLIVVADQKCIDAVRSRTVAADREPCALSISARFARGFRLERDLDDAVALLFATG